MKIIKKGIAHVYTPWWVGCRIKCGRCRTVIELEHRDDLDKILTVLTERSIDGDSHLIVTCPICGDVLNWKVANNIVARKKLQREEPKP